MAVLQMQRICIGALKEERKQILELIQRFGVIEISDVDYEDSVFHKSDVAGTINLLTKNMNDAKEALEILEHYAPEKKTLLAILNGRKEITDKQYDEFSEKRNEVLNTVNRIITLAKIIAEKKAEILKLKAQAEVITPWMGLDVPLNFTGTKYTSSFIGTLPQECTYDFIYEKLADQFPVNVEIISSSKEQTCIFVLCLKDKADKVSEILRGMGFSYPSIPIDKAGKEYIDYLNKQIKTSEQTIQQSEEEIKSYGTKREEIRFLLDYETMRSEKYEAIGHLIQSNNAFVLKGFIPKTEAPKLVDTLNRKFDVAIELTDPKEDEDVPVLLRNNGFSSPLESTVEAFSPPGKEDIDPTFVMSLFYYLLFGLMLSDAGYGIIMTAGCAFGLIKFKKTLEESMRRALKMFLFCGISTVFWGVMFGSYFGDLIDVISEAFFGHKVSIPPLWFVPVNEPMRMLVFSLLLGVIHIFAGLGIKFYICVRKKDYKSLLYDVVFWYVLLITLIIILLSTQMIIDIFGVDLGISSVAVKVCGVLAVIAAIGITLTNGRESRNPFKRFLKGLYALYGISGYLSDVLSYSRLLALGLATGVICNVINKMAGMTASAGVIGIVPFIVIVVLGHALNLGINALGAYVHTNRLQYVEFFGKFYEGGGRKFMPFCVKTKYYKFKEETK
ncbi:MAG: V-type ATP synthase subunit I [Lachnoclostridium sp.]|jgi:V/A-type H+/Na+-transporting ATPase subunit I